MSAISFISNDSFFKTEIFKLFSPHNKNFQANNFLADMDFAPFPLTDIHSKNLSLYGSPNGLGI